MKTYKVIKKLIPLSMFGSDEVTIEFTEEEVKDIIEQYNKCLDESSRHKRKYFVPKVGEDYWSIDNTQTDICLKTNTGTHFDNFMISIGNSFATKQDGQDELNRRQALVRIWNNYDDKYSWDIDWDDLENKYCVLYDYRNKKFVTNSINTTWNTVLNTELPYFKSAEDRNQFVESNKEDLLTIFNIKK